MKKDHPPPRGPVSKGADSSGDDALGDRGDLAQRIATWSSSSPQTTDALPRGPFLKFADSSVEQAYLQFEYKRSKKIVVAGLAVGTLIMIGFLWVDPVMVRGKVLNSFHTMRVYVGIPAAVLGLVGSLLIKDARLWIPWVSLLILLGGLRQSASLWMADGGGFEILVMGTWNLMIVAFFLSAIPFRWAAAVSLLHGAVLGATAWFVGLPPTTPISVPAIDFVMIFLFCAFASYRYESVSRSQFVAQALTYISSARRIAAETDRNRWLAVIAAFLRHELGNAMTAISSSIDMAGRTQESSKLKKYLRRARLSTAFMRRLLAQVADATSLESAISKNEFEKVKLTDLVREHAEAFCESHGQLIELNLAESVCVRGNADALAQMLDKLLNNAREHGSENLPIRVALNLKENACLLAVSNVGDPLPSNVEQLFQPFVTSKVRRVRGGNLGLGLFVVQTIATQHGGSLAAEPLPSSSGQVGACFTVSLPLCRE